MTLSASEQSPLNIIYFSSIDWNHTWQRPQQLASRLTKFGKLLYVNPLGLRGPGWGDWKRVLRRVAFSLTSHPWHSQESALTVYSPLIFSPNPSGQLSSRIAALLLRRAISRWMAQNGIDAPVFWVGVPSPAVQYAIEGLKDRLLVYDCIDDFALFHKNGAAIRATECAVAERAQIVFATARALFERLKQVNPHTFLIPNAADYDHFDGSARHFANPPDELAGLAPPILGYIGEIAHWFDFDILHDLAVANPQWQIALIGHAHVNIPRQVLQLSNVHFLGPKPYAQLPSYLAFFDVCLLPFRINALTNAVNPIKLYEYLAAGKPVVSTPLPELVQMESLVRISERTDFANTVRLALETDSESKKQERRQFAEMNSWDRRVEEIVHHLQTASRLS